MENSPHMQGCDGSKEGGELALKFFFTKESALPIRKIWDDLASEGLSSYMKESGSTPGITLGVFESGLEKDIVALAENFAAESTPFDLACWGVGNFPTIPAHVFLGITLSAELSERHREFLKAADKVGIVSSYHQIGNWVPHSTLSIRCKIDDIPEITKVCLRHDTRLTARAGSVAIVRIGSADVLAEFPLKE